MAKITVTSRKFRDAFPTKKQEVTLRGLVEREEEEKHHETYKRYL